LFQRSIGFFFDIYVRAGNIAVVQKEGERSREEEGFDYTFDDSPPIELLMAIYIRVEPEVFLRIPLRNDSFAALRASVLLFFSILVRYPILSLSVSRR